MSSQPEPLENLLRHALAELVTAAEDVDAIAFADRAVAASRPRRTRGIVVSAAVVGIVGIGGVAAAAAGGRLFGQAGTTYSAQRAAPNFGVTGKPEFKVAAKTPDGGQAEVWIADGRNGSECSSLLYGDPGRRPPGKPYNPALEAACSTAHALPLRGGAGGVWTSNKTGTDYWAIDGYAGPGAKTVRIATAGLPPVPATVGNGWYIAFIPYAWANHGGPGFTTTVTFDDGHTATVTDPPA